MLPNRVSNPGPLTYESDVLPIALRGPARWSGGAKVLGKLSVPGRPAGLDDSTGGDCLDIFFSHLSFLFSFSLSLGDGPI